MLFFTYKTDVLHKKGEKGIIFIYIIRYIDNYIYKYTIYSSYIYTRARGAAPTPLRHAESFRLVVPSSLPLLLLPFSSSPYIPHGAQPRPLPYIPSPTPRRRCAPWMLHRSPLLSVDHQARPPPFRAAVCKILFQAREVFRLFCAVLPPYSAPALWLTRRRVCTSSHAKKTGLFTKLCAVSILLRINILHTQKKVSLFTKKTCKKLARFKYYY